MSVCSTPVGVWLLFMIEVGLNLAAGPVAGNVVVGFDFHGIICGLD